MQSIFKRYPGSKRKHPIYDGGHYNAVIEPFAGSAALSFQMLRRGCQSIFLADTDPTIRAVYEVWADPSLHEQFYACIRSYLALLREKPDQAWEVMTSKFVNSAPIPVPEISAISLIVRDLTFGGIVRVNDAGKFNAVMVQGQYEKLKRWGVERYALPYAPKHLVVASDALELLDQYSAHGWGDRALCLIDAPYWTPLPSHRSYGDYEPSDPKWLLLCLAVTKKALSNPRISRVVVINYWSGELDQGLQELSQEVGHDRPYTSRLGKLANMQRGRGFVSKNVEYMWEFGAACRQLSLALG